MDITIDGKDYEVAHLFHLHMGRAIIRYEGLFVLVDKKAGGWELSGVPATEEEKKILEELTAPMNDQSVVFVHAPDEEENT